MGRIAVKGNFALASPNHDRSGYAPVASGRDRASTEVSRLRRGAVIVDRLPQRVERGPLVCLNLDAGTDDAFGRCAGCLADTEQPSRELATVRLAGGKLRFDDEIGAVSGSPT